LHLSNWYHHWFAEAAWWYRFQDITILTSSPILSRSFLFRLCYGLIGVLFCRVLDMDVHVHPVLDAPVFLD
jgi:hypothetical protein